MWDTLKFEDRSRLGDVSSVFVDYPKDWNRVIKESVGVHLGLASFLVENPLVDLDPLETGLSFGLFPKLSRDFSTMVIEQIRKDFHLLISLAHTVDRHDRHVVVEVTLI